jgi:hypothetical protein
MNRFIKISLSIALTACSFCLLSVMCCTQLLSTNDGGFGSETTNGKVIGAATLQNGSYVSGARVIVRRSDFVSPLDPMTSLTKQITVNTGDGITNKAGCFMIDSLDTGVYVIEINDGRAHAACRQFRISHDVNAINIGTDTLKMYASVQGEIGISSATDKRYVQVCGLERLVPVDANGSYTIDNLPAGKFNLRIVSLDTAVQSIVIDSIETKPGALTDAPAIGWTHSQNVILNTSATGANITGDVYHFPVLIRLTKGNFPFNQAKRNGEDLRFVKDDGTMLPFEIEHWDSSGGQAQIWVTADTVRGLNDTQFIVMRWGNPGAKDLSNGFAAFDTSNGFRAVWHLNQKCDDITSNKNNGINYGASDTTGIIGFCKKFKGTDYIEISGLLGSPQSFTLSAWAQLDSLPFESGSEIVSIGDAALIRMDYSILSHGTMGAIHPYSFLKDSGFCNTSSGQFLKQTGWHLITYSVDQKNSRLTLFIDGTIARSDTGNNLTIDYTGLGQNTIIGNHGNAKTGFGFSGRIDEVRVYSTSVSADYVKLCYMNQKAQDALVVFK